jgi:hypothetical protein
MTTSPQFRQAILNNLERINTLNISAAPYATLGMYTKDYSKHNFLARQKSTSFLKNVFLQKVF